MQRCNALGCTCQNSLAICYMTGTGVPKNGGVAYRWFHQAATAGCVRAQVAPSLLQLRILEPLRNAAVVWDNAVTVPHSSPSLCHTVQPRTAPGAPASLGRGDPLVLSRRGQRARRYARARGRAQTHDTAPCRERRNPLAPVAGAQTNLAALYEAGIARLPPASKQTARVTAGQVGASVAIATTGGNGV